MYEYTEIGIRNLSETLADMANKGGFCYKDFFDYLKDFDRHKRKDFKELVESKGMSPNHFGNSMKRKKIKFGIDNGRSKFDALVSFLEITGRGKPSSPFVEVNKVDEDHFYFSFASFNKMIELQKDTLMQKIQGHYKSYKQSHEKPDQVSVGHVHIWETPTKAIKVKETLWLKQDNGETEVREYNGYIWHRKQIGETEPLFWLDREDKHSFVRIIRLTIDEQAKNLNGTARYARERYDAKVNKKKDSRKFFTKHLWLEKIEEKEAKDPENFVYIKWEDAPEKLKGYIDFNNNRYEDVL
jgi:hypothetical protein